MKSGLIGSNLSLQLRDQLVGCIGLSPWTKELQVNATFEVQRESDRVILTPNMARLRRRPALIGLETRILSWKRPEEAMLVADLEQCAAIGLLIPGFPDLA